MPAQSVHEAQRHTLSAGQPANPIDEKAIPFTVNLLDPPREGTSEDTTESLLPSTYRTDEGDISTAKSNDQKFLEAELSVDRLNDVYKHLWFAGLPVPPRPLHYQLVLCREIIICEAMDLHLIWGNGRIFLKPIPQFLLSPTFWREHLQCEIGCGCSHGRQCATMKLRSIALGFLFSYAALLSHESDFIIAKDKGLLPIGDDRILLRWTEWRKFVAEILSTTVYTDIHRRFHYGELRLGRLNIIYILTTYRSYINQWPTYNSFLRDQLGWLAGTTIYIALALTAMQLGLATDQLKANDSFMAASYGFSIFAILGPLISVGMVLLVLVAIVLVNWRFQRTESEKRFKHMESKRGV